MSSPARIKEEPADETVEIEIKIEIDDAPTMLEQSDPQYTMCATCKPEPCDTDMRTPPQELEQQHMSEDFEEGARGGTGMVKVELDIGGPVTLQPSDMALKQEPKQEPDSKGVDVLSAGDRKPTSEICVPGKSEHSDGDSEINIGSGKICSRKILGDENSECQNYSSQLKTNMSIDTGGKPFKCSTCSKSFSKSFLLKRHMLTHTGEKPFKCSTCSKFFSRSSNLKTHMLKHTGEKCFECSTCHKYFSQSQSLKRHMLKHTGEKKIKCTTCSKYYYKSYLKRHMLTHTREKRYRCTTCNKCFSKAVLFKRHTLSHSGAMPFKCSVCLKYFSGHYLKKHMLTHTNDKPFKCLSCFK